MKYTVTIAGTTVTVEIHGTEVLVDGTPVAVAQHRGRGPVRRLVVGGRSLEVVAGPGEEPATWVLAAEGERVTAQVLDERSRTLRALARKVGSHDGPHTVRAPMPGLVVRVLVAPGDRVAAGRGLVVVEAMKMENELKAGADGIVEEIHVAPGSRVEKGAPLVRLGSVPAP